MGIKLTPRQYDVAIRLHKESVRIAEELGVKPITVKVHLLNLYKKLHCSSRAEAILKCLKLGLVDINSFEIDWDRK